MLTGTLVFATNHLYTFSVKHDPRKAFLCGFNMICCGQEEGEVKKKDRLNTLNLVIFVL